MADDSVEGRGGGAAGGGGSARTGSGGAAGAGGSDRTGAVGAAGAAAVPDYELPDELLLTEPQQYRALFEDTRQQIVSLLSERAATISELAEVLGKPKGTIGHHMNVLAQAGLVHVVRTEKVRALVAKYWGRTARVFYYHRIDAAVGGEQRILERAAAEVARLESGPKEAVFDVNRREARIPAERAAEFNERLAELLIEFADQPRSGSETYVMLYGLYRSGRGALAEHEAPAVQEPRDEH